MQAVAIEEKKSETPAVLTYEQKMQEIFDRADRQMAQDIAASREKFAARMEVFETDMKKITGNLTTLRQELEARDLANQKPAALTLRQSFAALTADLSKGPVVANLFRKLAGKPALATAEFTALGQMRNLEASIAANAYDLVTSGAYRAKAEKDGLFKVDLAMNTDAPKSKLTLAAEKALNCQISTTSTRQFAVGGIEEVRVSLASMMRSLDNGQSLSSVQDRYDTAKKDVANINGKMNAVYAVNAPKDAAAGIEEATDAAIEKTKKAFSASAKAIVGGFVQAGKEFCAAFKSDKPAKAPEAPKPVKILSRAEQLDQWRKTRR